FFFFFQAEDGIRDLIVTGVQTCALPISARVDGRRLHATRSRASVSHSRVETSWCSRANCGAGASACVEDHSECRCISRAGYVRRSEERRVGKECRYGGAPEW